MGRHLQSIQHITVCWISTPKMGPKALEKLAVPEQILIVARIKSLPGLMNLIEELSVYFHFQVQGHNWMLTQVVLRNPLHFGEKAWNENPALVHHAPCNGVPWHTLQTHMVWSAYDAMPMMDYFNIFLKDSFQNGIFLRFQKKNAAIEDESKILRTWDLCGFIAAMHNHFTTFWMQAETVDHRNVHF